MLLKLNMKADGPQIIQARFYFWKAVFWTAPVTKQYYEET